VDEVLGYFFRQNLWANLQLIDFCRSLSDDQLDSTVPGTMGTIRQILQHILGAEGRYVTGLGGTLPAGAVDERTPWPGFDALEAAARSTGEALIALASERLADRQVERNLGDRSFRVPAKTVLVQAFQHGTDHRSQAQTIITQLGLEPPALDAWAYARAVGEFVEL